MIELLNIDCMEYMKTCDDNQFDLAIVDPPYGIERFRNGQSSRISKYGQMSTTNDMRPAKQYFDELIRISNNQIIWGYNHLSDLLPTTKEFIFWFKQQPVDSYSDGELAWTSFKKTAKCFNYPFFGCHGSDVKRIHPTQKPVKLYQWLLKNYSEPGQSILDTHLGSASSAIAAHYFGCDFVGCEIDNDYFDSAMKRFNNETSQLAMSI